MSAQTRFRATWSRVRTASARERDGARPPSRPPRHPLAPIFAGTDPDRLAWWDAALADDAALVAATERWIARTSELALAAVLAGQTTPDLEGDPEWCRLVSSIRARGLRRVARVGTAPKED